MRTMGIEHVYPKSYKTVERVIAHSWHPKSFESHKTKTVDIVDYSVACGFGIDFIHYSGLVSEIPKELQKKRCGNLVQIDNEWRIELK